MAKLLKYRWALVMVCAPLLVAGSLLLAQTGRVAAPPATPADRALRALHLNRFDEVERLLQGAADARSIAIRARANIERGRYADAEKLLAGPAKADPAGDAALELGLLQAYLGRRAEATRTLNRLVDSSRPRTALDHARLGVAASTLGRLLAEAQLIHDANEFFRTANRLAPGDPYVSTLWGELYLATYDYAQAMTWFRAALEAEPDYVPALMGMARVSYQQNPPSAKTALEAVFKLNPQYVPAHLLAAEIALDERRRDQARAAVEQALDVNPASLEARSLRGAIAFLEGRTADFEREVRETLAINPTYGEIYRVAGDHAARAYRFDEAVVLAERAVMLDPDNPRAQGDLGLHLMRTGNESAARAALERAFKGDPFYTVTFNLLELLDKLEKFQTITDGDITFRFDPSEAGVMREHAVPLAKEALATLQKQYEFTVRGPILIEMFPVHDDFAVRTLGLPGMVGALGACFGRVVTLDSPRARPPGEFNWGETLWHELAHVITLQMSNNRLPRWASEGISGWEERRARPEWGRDGELQFAQAMNEGKVIRLDVLNEAFSDGRTIGLAYYQSSLVIEHLVETYGEPRLRAMLRAYGRGADDEEAFKEAFGATVAEIQASFDARIERQFASLRAALRRPDVKGEPGLEELKAIAASNPQSFAVQMQLGQALAEAGDHGGAIQAFERAAQLVPRAPGPNNPHGYIAEIALKAGDTDRAIRALEAKLQVDSSDVDAARKLASLVEPLNDPLRLERVYQRIVAVDPFDVQAQTALGRLLLRKKDALGALRAFRSVLAAEPPDKASAHVDVAEAYLLAGQTADAKREALAALEIAPAFERAQDLLLKIVEAEAGGA